jgi:hypothetical protein
VVDSLGERAAGTVVLAAVAAAGQLFGDAFAEPDALGEHPHPVGHASAVLADGVADDVVVQHGGHHPTPLLGRFGQQRAAQQSLLLTRQSGIDDRGVELLAR